MENGRSVGSDGLPPVIFEQLRDSLSPPLCLLFWFLMSISSVPNDWQFAHIIPIFKFGSFSQFANIRSISLTWIACRLTERIINADLLVNLHQHKLISKAQHSFISRSSTTTNLLGTSNDWSDHQSQSWARPIYNYWNWNIRHLKWKAINFFWTIC